MIYSCQGYLLDRFPAMPYNPYMPALSHPFSADWNSRDGGQIYFQGEQMTEQKSKDGAPAREVTVAEFAELTGIEVRTVRNMIYRRAITARLFRTDPTVKKGVYIIPISEVEKTLRWLQKNSRPI